MVMQTNTAIRSVGRAREQVEDEFRFSLPHATRNLPMAVRKVVAQGRGRPEDYREAGIEDSRLESRIECAHNVSHCELLFLTSARDIGLP